MHLTSHLVLMLVQTECSMLQSPILTGLTLRYFRLTSLSADLMLWAVPLGNESGKIVPALLTCIQR